MKARWLVFGTTLMLCSCVGSITEPVVVIGRDGRILRGTTTAGALGRGSFSVTDGKLTCSGTYNSLDLSVTIAIPTNCSDGRSGIIISTRDANGIEGSGHVTLSDGYTGDFIFGPQALSITAPSAPTPAPFKPASTPGH